MELAFNDYVLIAVYLITGLSFYWKMRLDIEALNLKIEELREDRVRRWKEQNEKWACHDENKQRGDDKIDRILAGVSGLQGDIKAINQVLSFLKKE